MYYKFNKLIISYISYSILVGAPKDTFKSFNMSGAIYKCPFNLNRIDDCEQISVDFTSQLNSDESSRKYSDSTLLDQFKGRLFENQWFGVSLSSTGYGAFSVSIYFGLENIDFL